MSGVRRLRAALTALACLAIGASAMALVYRGLLMRSEQAALRGLQDRVARLETGQAS